MKILPLVIMLAMSTTVAAADVQKGDITAGATKVAICLSCHGENGAKPLAPIYPSLAGQSEEYLVNALHAYRDGLRKGGMAEMMTPMAAMLSDQDVRDIAAYYSQQDPYIKPK